MTSYTTVSSTASVCSCGGTIDLFKEKSVFKDVFKIGKYKLMKFVRTTYQCTKCKQYR